MLVRYCSIATRSSGFVGSLLLILILLLLVGRSAKADENKQDNRRFSPHSKAVEPTVSSRLRVRRNGADEDEHQSINVEMEIGSKLWFRPWHPTTLEDPSSNSDDDKSQKEKKTSSSTSSSNDRGSDKVIISKDDEKPRKLTKAKTKDKSKYIKSSASTSSSSTTSSSSGESLDEEEPVEITDSPIQQSTSPPTQSPVVVLSPGPGPAEKGSVPTFCPVSDLIMLGVSGDEQLYYNNFLFCQGTFRAPIQDNVIEIVVDPTTNRVWAQVGGRDVFEMYEMNVITGEEIPGTRFSTKPVNQFHALEFVNGVLYGGGWEKLDGASEFEGSSLYRIDPDAGTFEEIGPTGVRPLTGMACDGTTLYATSGAGWPPAELYTINIETGQATIICEDMTQGFGSLVYYPATGVLYGGTPDGFISEIDPITCSTKNTEGFELFWWFAGYGPITGLAMFCA